MSAGLPCASETEECVAAEELEVNWNEVFLHCWPRELWSTEGPWVSKGVKPKVHMSYFRVSAQRQTTLCINPHTVLSMIEK